MSRFETHYRIWNTILLTGILTITTLLATAEITADGLQLFFSRRALPPLCVYQARYGIECPACGLTRSVITLLQGDYRRSVEFHPYGRLIVAFLAIQFCLRSGLLIFRGEEFWKWDLAVTGVAIAVCFGPFLFL